MRDLITPDIIANEISMARSQVSGAFLLVEGDTDARLFRQFIDKS